MTSAGAALAQSPKKLKAEFLCGVFANGKVTKPITGKKLGKITDPIACALHLANPDEPGHSVHVRTVRGGKEMSNVTGVVNEDGSTKDFEIHLKPGVKNENGEIAWKPCEDFDIEVGIFDPGGQYKKTIKVVQGCPKPKPVKGKLVCYYQTDDGTQFTFPGNGTKKKPRMEKDLQCSIGLPDLDNPGDGWKGSLAIKGKSAHVVEVHPMEAGAGADFAFPSAEFGACANFTVIGSITDPDGNERFSGKLAIQQNCPD
jgi:hypothetical protein